MGITRRPKLGLPNLSGALMSIDYVRRYYDVPAKKGGRVEYTGGATPQFGTICGAQGAHLTIRLDGMKHTMPYHPTWKLRYLDENSADTASQHMPAQRNGEAS